MVRSHINENGALWLSRYSVHVYDFSVLSWSYLALTSLLLEEPTNEKKNLQMGCLWLSNSFWTHYTYTSYAMLSSGILWSIPRVTYYLLSIHASDVKYIWNNTYLNCRCRWKWRMIIATRWTLFSFIHTSLTKEMQLQIRLVAKSNANYARRTMGRLGVLPSSV